MSPAPKNLLTANRRELPGADLVSRAARRKGGLISAVPLAGLREALRPCRSLDSNVDVAPTHAGRRAAPVVLGRKTMAAAAVAPMGLTPVMSGWPAESRAKANCPSSPAHPRARGGRMYMWHQPGSSAGSFRDTGEAIKNHTSQKM
jgi:hypothetical protein